MKNLRRKRNLIDQIQDRTDINRIAVERVVEAFMDEVIKIVSEDGRLELRNFGIFEVATREERFANNPKTGDRILIPRRRVVTFKAGKHFTKLATKRAGQQTFVVQDAAPNTF